MAQCSPPGPTVGSDLGRQESMGDAGLHIERFPGYTVLCMADLTVTQMKTVYVLHAHSTVGLLSAAPAWNCTWLRDTKWL